MSNTYGTTYTGNLNLSDPLDNPLPKTLAEAVASVEKDNIAFREEYILIRSIVKEIRGILGMPTHNPGEAIKLSTALKEISLEINKRMDIFGTIAKSIPEDIRV
jgi:hypothetical protein